MKNNKSHPIPKGKVRRKEVEMFIDMPVGSWLITDRLGVAAIMQYGYRHGMAAKSRQTGKNNWMVWRVK